MPVYEYHCAACHWNAERIVPVDERDTQTCSMCGDPLGRLLSRPAPFQVRGRVVQGGGPDRFTADQLGIPLKELPDSLKV